MSSSGNRKRSKSRSRSRDKKDKYKNSHSNDYKDKDKSSYHKNRNRKVSDEGVKLYISNLGSSVTEKRVLEEFKHFGEVIDISLKRKNGKSNFFGYVVMKNKNIAEKAMNHINKDLGWKVTLYEKEEKREKYRDKSKSISRSRSISKSYNKNEDEEKNIEQDTKSDDKKPIRVREIWVGNLPNNINESSLYNQFFIYGEISRIECHFQTDKNFAFIKYKQASAASRAYEKAKNMNLYGNVIRVSFSDSGKRRDIIGDESGYEVNEKTCKLLHLSLNRNSPVANENVLRDLFKKYGTIKGLHIKNSVGYRPAIYLEYSKPEEAENALNNLTVLDVNSEKRKLIGDAMCDINYYFKKKYNPINQMNMMNQDMNNNLVKMNLAANMQMNMNPNMKMMYPFMMNQMNPQMRFMPRPMQNNPLNTSNLNSNTTNPTTASNLTNTSSSTQSVPTTANNSLSEAGGANQSFSNMNFPGNFYNPMNQSTIPPMMQRFPFPINHMNRPMMFPNNFPMIYNSGQQQLKQPEQNQVKDLIENALQIIKSQSTQNESAQEVIDDQDLSSIRDTPNIFEKEYSLEEENLKNIWGGFLTKNKKDRVCVDAYQIRNECSDYLNNEYNLNVSHRTQFEDIVKRPIIGIIAFSPQNATQCEIFQDYINYFNEKNRVGVINLKNQMILYLIPPSDFSRKFYQNPKKHLLGIFVNSTVEPKSYVDMNNLSLPPPVISLTEKRVLLKQKNSSVVHNSAPNTNVQINSNNEKNNDLTKLLGLEPEKIELLLKNASDGQLTNNLSNDLTLLLSNPQLKNLIQLAQMNNK